jgi:hypothetical protein
LNPTAILNVVKKLNKSRMEKIIKFNPSIAENYYIDNNNIEFILFVNQFLKTLRLIFLAFNFSFFIGMGWLIMCKIYEDWYNFEVRNNIWEEELIADLFFDK